MKKILRLCVLSVALLVACGMHAVEAGQTVRLARGSRSVFIKNSSLNSGEAAQMWTETNVNAQRWILEAGANDLFYLKNAYTNFYLGATGTVGTNGPVGQAAKSASKSLWDIVPVEGKPNTYIIYLTAAHRYCMAAPANDEEGGPVTLVAASNADESRIHWTVEETTSMENALTTDKRDELMENWKTKFYRKASTGHVIGNGGWWGDAEMFEIVLDAYETTGDAQYLTMFDELYKNFCQRNNTDWSGNNFNDDIAWMCIACIRAYLMSGVTDYRDKAKTNFDKMYTRANKYGDGTLIWCMNWEGNGWAGTNSCVNGPAAVCACYLGIAYNQETYFTKAKTIYAGERALLMEQNADGTLTGKVWDSYDKKKDDGSRNYWASSYNQGTQLGAAMMLYNHYGEEMYKKDADAIMSWTYKNMSNDKKLITACQNQSGDLSGFKGILMRYVRRYAAEHAHPEYYEWMAKSAYHAWNNRNSSGISDNAWHSKTNETATYLDNGQTKNCSSEGCMSCVSAAFNAHLGAVDVHPAYARTEAEDFNFIQGANVMNGDDEDGSRMAGHLRNKQYLGYRLMKFGNKAASHLSVRAKLLKSSSKITFYADAANATRGKLLCSIAAADFAQLGQWETIEKELAVPINGEHDIYMVCTGSASGDLADVNWFEFDARNAMYADVTKLGGKLSTSFAAGETQLSNLIDGTPTTGCVFSLNADGEAWIQYQAAMPVALQGYGFYTGLTANTAPTSLTLQGSNDGTTWVNLDQKDALAFTTCGQCLYTPLAVEQAYSYFRFVFPTTESAILLSVSELQLVGRGICTIDLTADGGTVSEGHEALTDKDAATTLDVPATVTYKSNGNYRLTAYSVTGVKAGDVLSWVVEGSDYGSSWKQVDKQADVTIPYDMNTMGFAVQAAAPYNQYRIRFIDHEAKVAEWQLFGNLDYGTFFADAAEICKATASADAATLSDNDGTTEVDIDGEVHYYSPIPLKPVGFALVCGSDASLDPVDMTLYGVNDETQARTQLSTKTLEFPIRGKRLTFTVSTSNTYSHMLMKFNESENHDAHVRLSEVELYASAIAEQGSDVFVLPAAFTSNTAGATNSTGIERANDQSRTTMYQANFTAPIVINIDYDKPQLFDTYAISASKNAAANDPKAWTLEVSNDKKTWTTLDARQDETFSHRYATQFYATNQGQTAYTYYRVTINETAGGNLLQLGQLQLLNLANSALTPVEDVTANQQAGIGLLGDLLCVETPVATTVRVYDLQGRMLLTKAVEAGRSTLALTGQQGVLVVVMKVAGKNVVKKILK